jgi:hypothetical protein
VTCVMEQPIAGGSSTLLMGVKDSFFKYNEPTPRRRLFLLIYFFVKIKPNAHRQSTVHFTVPFTKWLQFRYPFVSYVVLLQACLRNFVSQ